MEDFINNPTASREERLTALRNYERRHPQKPKKTGEVNNHIHTVYSFSPYTPAMAALKARNAGLEAAGSVDHDSIGAAAEMRAACAELGIGGCTGFEIRVRFDPPFKDRKLNNPDSAGIAYMTVQGIPQPAIPEVQRFLEPIRAERLRRTRRMADAANALLSSAGFEAREKIDFQRDIIDASQYADAGGVTERHLLAAMGAKLIQRYGKGAGLTEGLKAQFGVTPPPQIEALLGDPGNPHYLFDLLGVLKANFLPRIFIQPDENECIPAKTVTAFADRIGGIAGYAYLGDVAESPTGDKKAERFEDAYLDELFQELRRLGYRAVTYMPPRNTPEQLRRVQRLCASAGFMEISGVDINSSRQSFNCPEVLMPECRHLVDTTWALIAHECLAGLDPELGLFSPRNPLSSAPLGDRLAAYAGYGKKLDLTHPEQSASAMAKKIREGL